MQFEQKNKIEQKKAEKQGKDKASKADTSFIQ